ncbi:MAG: MMPL family transporter [Clostridiales bacterium]|nr:MMPL family transporter [Clostridiales bacterium]
MRFAKAVVKFRIPIIIFIVILMIPSMFGMMNTRINYDMLSYLPEDMDTVVGQDELLDEFEKGAFAFVIVEDMPNKEVAKLCDKIEAVDHVDSIISYASLADASVPKDIIPDKIYKEFNSDNATLMAVFFDSATSADETLAAVEEVRSVAGKQCFVAGMSAMVVDLKQISESEEIVYVILAVLICCIAMLLLLDNWIIPFVFIGSIGMMILLNLGSNYFLGEISFITKALAAVLQLAVTMDYSIFLWHSYNEQREKYSDNKEAMAMAIKATLTSVVGGSTTTIAGFIALCFMTFTLGLDLGIVMTKGVVLGVIGCVTVLPSLILVLDKPLQKAKHRSLIPNMNKIAKGLVKVFPVFLVIFAALLVPSYMNYQKASNEVYYDMAKSLPEDMDYIISNSKLSEEFDTASTHMVLVDSSLPSKSIRSMISDMEDVDGVKYVLGLESIVGSRIPEEVIPDGIKEVLKGDKWELLLINSEYSPASDEANNQVNSLNAVLKRYDENGMLIGEAPCTKDMIETTDQDFKVVNTISIIAIFLIIALSTRSISLPVILIAVIEFAIFINLGLPHLLGQQMSFITPICISTIQLGATVDYAILMTTRYKTERMAGNDKRTAITTALSTSIPSIIVAGMSLFSATFGVALYSNMEMISSMCMLMARGAIISMICVIFILPSMLMLCDKIVCATTFGMRKIGKNGNDKPPIVPPNRSGVTGTPKFEKEPIAMNSEVQ